MTVSISVRRTGGAGRFEQEPNSTSQWMMAVMVPVIVVACASAAMAQRGATGSREAYRLTLQVLGGMAGCVDRFSAPEYYATAYRRDAGVERQVAAIDRELRELGPRVMQLNARIAPLAQREHRTRPLSDEQRRELEELRETRLELARERREGRRRVSSEEGEALGRELARIDGAVQALEERIPLTDEEALSLRDLRSRLAPLDDRTRALNAGRREFRAMVAMRTPGALRVYPNDSLRLRLMETDVLSDDECATWRLTLDREVLEQGGAELKVGGRALLRAWVQPVGPAEATIEAAERASLEARVAAALQPETGERPAVARAEALVESAEGASPAGDAAPALRPETGERPAVARAEALVESAEGASPTGDAAPALRPETGERPVVARAEALVESAEGASPAGDAAPALRPETRERQRVTPTEAIIEAAERASLEAGVAAALQTETRERRRSMTRTWSGVGLLALGLLMPFQQETCVTVLGLEVGCVTEVYTPGVVVGVSLSGIGVMLATIWSDVPAAPSLDVGPGRIGVSKTLAW